MEIKLTVLFEQPFWVGVFEICDNGKYCVYKYLFGSEPKDFDIYEILLKKYFQFPFSNPIEDENLLNGKTKTINPKRMQKMIKKATQEKGIGTKAQRAIQAEREQMKELTKKKNKQNLKEIKDIKYQKKREMLKQKKKGH